jgi:hypothetical protein
VITPLLSGIPIARFIRVDFPEPLSPHIITNPILPPDSVMWDNVSGSITKADAALSNVMKGFRSPSSMLNSIVGMYSFSLIPFIYSGGICVLGSQ